MTTERTGPGLDFALSIPSNPHFELPCQLIVDRAESNLATLWRHCALIDTSFTLCTLKPMIDFAAVRHSKYVFHSRKRDFQGSMFRKSRYIYSQQHGFHCEEAQV